MIAAGTERGSRLTLKRFQKMRTILTHGLQYRYDSSLTGEIRNRLDREVHGGSSPPARIKRVWRNGIRGRLDEKETTLRVVGLFFIITFSSISRFAIVACNVIERIDEARCIDDKAVVSTPKA